MKNWTQIASISVSAQDMQTNPEVFNNLQGDKYDYRLVTIMSGAGVVDTALNIRINNDMVRKNEILKILKYCGKFIRNKNKKFISYIFNKERFLKINFRQVFTLKPIWFHLQHIRIDLSFPEPFCTTELDVFRINSRDFF